MPCSLYSSSQLQHNTTWWHNVHSLYWIVLTWIGLQFTISVLVMRQISSFNQVMQFNTSDIVEKYWMTTHCGTDVNLKTHGSLSIVALKYHSSQFNKSLTISRNSWSISLGCQSEYTLQRGCCLNWLKIE